MTPTFISTFSQVKLPAFFSDNMILQQEFEAPIWGWANAGEEIKITPKDQSRELIQAWDPSKSDNAADYVVSAYIEAVKPF